jgi:hypothetical protein
MTIVHLTSFEVICIFLYLLTIVCIKLTSLEYKQLFTNAVFLNTYSYLLIQFT